MNATRNREAEAVGWCRKGHSVQLLPENPDFEPIEVDLRRDALTIEGVAVGVIRNGRSL